MNSIFSTQPADLSSLTAEKAVEIFRDVLWCHAKKKGVPVTNVHISSKVYVKDGGVDARVDNDSELAGDDLLIAAGTCYQIKTGSTFLPWRPSQLRNELFGKSISKIDLSNLNSQVKQCLEGSKRYIIVCFGVDPTPEQRDSSQKTLISDLRKCGFSDPKVDIWGQTHIIGLLSDFPSLCLRILGRAEFQFQSIESWAQNADMRSDVKLGDAQNVFIETIRSELRNGNHHLRIIGEPGIGKTRLVLEALSVEDLGPNVIYIPHAEDFQHSQLFNELLKSDNSFYVILVIDECPEKERASIWNVLKGRRERCSLITIDHGPETSSDESMKVLECSVLADKEIANILNNYISSKNDAERWAPWCSGSPRVAHAVGQNLKQNPDDILKPPAVVPIWERFIAGYEDPDTESNKEKLIVLRHLALFERFGFESPVSDEARFISDIVTEIDSRITWGRFQSIVESMKGRRIVQGKTTLFLVPKALHIYLWLEYWKHYGRGFNFESFMGRLPDTLRGWFTRMFIYAHANPQAQEVVKDILSPDGPYDDEVFLTSELGCRFISVLAEADPRATLSCIERTLGKWPKEKLLAWNDNRQSVVWALEKIAVWPDTFIGAARMLLKMGATETSKYSNNASGTFAGLFSLAYGPVAPTETPPDKRLPVLKEALESEDSGEKALGLKACESALSTYWGFRLIGAEYQGLKPTARLWVPKIYDEIFDAYSSVWDLLFSLSRDWPEESRRLANNVLINASTGLVQRPPFVDTVLTTLEKLISDRATELREVVNFITYARRYMKDNLPEDVMKRINRLDDMIAGETLESQIWRYVLFSSWDEERDPELQESYSLEGKLKELAKQSIKEKNVLVKILNYLVRTEGHKLYQFGLELAVQDSEREIFPLIVNAQRAAGANGNTQLIGGYLYGVRQIDETMWEQIIIDLMFEKDFANIAGQLVRRTGVNGRILQVMITAYKDGIVKANDFLVLQYRHEIKGITHDLIESVLNVLVTEGGEEKIGVALDIAAAVYSDKDHPIEMPEKLIYDLLTCPILFNDRLNTMQNYHWRQLAKNYLLQYPMSDLKIFKHILSYFEHDNFIILKSGNAFHEIAAHIARQKPSETWHIVKDLLGDLDSKLAWRILHWMEEEFDFGEEPKIRPITYFPLDEILAWLEKSSDTRAPAIARTAPKTLDLSDDGKITRELLSRYGHLKSVSDAMYANFGTGGWSGPASQYYRKKRDQARSWLEGETSPNVIRWLEEYIEGLNKNIKREEISEERRY